MQLITGCWTTPVPRTNAYKNKNGTSGLRLVYRSQKC